jgi:hypothetical protein
MMPHVGPMIRQYNIYSIQLQKKIIKNKRKKQRTAIKWDYGILPPSSIKGLPTDKNV